MKTRNPNLSLWNDRVRVVARKFFPAFFLLGLFFIDPQFTHAQCTTSVLNWDNMDFYYNSGSNVAPYGFSTPSNGNYITNAQAATQRFAIGRNYLTFALSGSMTSLGENATHQGDVTVSSIPY